MTLTELNMVSVPASQAILLEMMDVQTYLSGIKYTINEFKNSVKDGIKSFKDATTAIMLAAKNKKALESLNASIKHHIENKLYKPLEEKLSKLSNSEALIKIIKNNLFRKLYNVSGWNGVIANLSFIALSNEIISAINNKIDENTKGKVTEIGDVLIASVKSVIAAMFKKITHVPFKTAEKLFNALMKFKSYVIDIVSSALDDVIRGKEFWVRLPIVQSKEQMLGKDASFVTA